MPRPVGGQAVCNGVLMRGADAWAVAVRCPDGSIRVHREPLRPSSRAGRFPFVRGLVALGESMVLGVRAIKWSASASTGTDVRFGPLGVAAAAAAAAVFFLVPLLVAHAVTPDGARLAFGAVDAVVGTALLLGYISLIGRVPDVRTFFEYHGAEHKTVSAHEAGVELNAVNAQPFSTRHPRCGTSFTLVVAVLVAAINALVGGLELPLLVTARLLVIPIVVGLAYEALRFTADNLHRRWVRPLVRPGLALQGLTTREPRLDQLEVAVAALEAALSTADSPVDDSPVEDATVDATKGPLTARPHSGGQGAPRSLSSSRSS